MLALIQGEGPSRCRVSILRPVNVRMVRTVQIDEATPIIIEGIHALNARLTKSIPHHQKIQNIYCASIATSY